MIEQEKPTAAAVPAPWTLTGSGVILPYWLSKSWMAEHFPERSGQLGIAMWVNYQSGPVGPYHEWLFIPGKAKNPRGSHYSISHIRVDSEQSMLGGKANWGIPKDMAEFSWQQSDTDYRLAMTVGSGQLMLEGTHKGPSIPIHSGLLPFSLYQYRNATHFWTRPKAKGWGKWMHVDTCQYLSPGMPDLSEQRLLGAFAIPNFEMTFAVADTSKS